MEKTLEDDVSQLLTDVAETINKFEADWRENGEKYNIFKIAGIAHKEVYICRVLADLLNPKGKHCQGSRYLRLFWDTVSQKIPGGLALNIENTIVTAQRVTEEKRFIDIALWDGRIFVPIEVKIGAGDQEKQVADYYKFAKEINKDEVPLLYLTLDGHDPSDLSKDDVGKDAYVKLTFRDILAWLDECWGNTPKTTVPVRENLRQLTAAINSLYGKSEDKKMEDAIFNMVTGKDDLIRAALEIRRVADFENRIKKEFTDALVIVKEQFSNATRNSSDKLYTMEIPIKEGYSLEVNYDWTSVWLKAESCKVDSTSQEWENLHNKMDELLEFKGEPVLEQQLVWRKEDMAWRPSLEESYVRKEERDLYLAHLSKLSSQEVAERIIKIVKELKNALEDVKA
jgi:hypothetical protein